MNEHIDKDFWITLDRRLSDLESKHAQLQRDYQRDVTELSHDVKGITNRVNMGLSNSVHAVEKDNIAIKLAQSEQSHGFDKSIGEMRAVVREHTDLTKLMVNNFDTLKLKPVQDDVSMIKKTFIYGLVGALVVFLGQKGMNLLWDRVMDKPAIVTTHQPTTDTGHAP